jgi:alpha-amylase
MPGLTITRVRLAGGLILALAAPASAWDTLPSRTNDQPGFVFTPSPPDWRALPLYHVITDRFQDGDPANNDDTPGSDVNPFGTVSIHGGDFEGLQQKLDYVRLMGLRALWISPVVRNVDGRFHGYAAQDLNQIDPHWGTLADLRAFIDAAHARGLYVILDVVQNHLGDLATSTDSGYPNFKASGYTLRWRNSSRRHAAPFDDLARLHNYGNIHNWEDATQAVLGDFSGLDGLRTEDAGVRQDLIRIFQGLIEATDCDGFRVDTARHVEMGFWETFLPALYQHAAGLGKTNFLVFAEAWRSTDGEVGAFTATNRFNSALHFPLLSTLEDVFFRGLNTSRISDRLAGRGAYDPLARDQLVAFLDNHDMSRALASDKLAGHQARLKPALTYLYTGPHLPCLYYGTEQGFDGGNDPYDREDMFDGEFEFSASLGDNFNVTHDLFRHVRRLNLLREAYPELVTGPFEQRWQDYSASGLYVFTRGTGAQQVVVMFNTASGDRTAKYQSSGPQTAFSNGTVLANALDPLDTLTVGAGGVGAGQITFTLPGYAQRVYVRRERLQALPPTVTSFTPGHGTAGVSRATTLVFDFDQPMATAGVQAAFALSPAAPGAFSWLNNRTRMVFAPTALLAADTRYRVTIGATAAGTNGLPLGAAWESFFDTGTAGGAALPLGSFVLDGVLDGNVPLLAQHNGMSLWARYDATNGALYVATVDAGEGNDHFILLDDQLDGAGADLADWNKTGLTASDGPYLADENDNDFTSWYRVQASASAKTGPNGGVLEGVINVIEQYGATPTHLYLAVAPYPSQDGAGLLAPSQLPASHNFDQHVDADEYLRLNLLTGEILVVAPSNSQQEVGLKVYVIDGQLWPEEQAAARATNGLTLYADFNGQLLYVATEDAGEGNDHFIYVTDTNAPLLGAPWAKSGQVSGRRHFLADENDNDFEGWFIHNAMDLSHPAATTFNNGGALEGTLDLVAVFGRLPRYLYLAAVPYATGDGGALIPASQVPAGNGNGVVESNEYYVLDLLQFDTDADGLPDLVEDANGNGLQDGGETAARIVDSDGDGFGDGTEVTAGTDPLDPGNWFGHQTRLERDDTSSGASNGTVFIEWPGESGRVYAVDFTEAIGPGAFWQSTGFLNITGQGSTLRYTETNLSSGAAQRYYRIELRRAP